VGAAAAAVDAVEVFVPLASEWFLVERNRKYRYAAAAAVAAPATSNAACLLDMGPEQTFHCSAEVALPLILDGHLKQLESTAQPRRIMPCRPT
jgi:hypothetical protein